MDNGQERRDSREREQALKSPEAVKSVCEEQKALM
jgi:hypothetical protein